MTRRFDRVGVPDVSRSRSPAIDVFSPIHRLAWPAPGGTPAATGQRPVPPNAKASVRLSVGGTGLWPVDFGVSPKSRASSGQVSIPQFAAGDSAKTRQDADFQQA